MVVLDSGPLQKLGRRHYDKPYKTITSRNTNLDPRGQVAVIKPSKQLSLDPKHGFYGSYSTGYFALSAALCARARNIYLIGFDCRATKENGNFYNTKETKGYMRSDPEGRYARMTAGFDKFIPHKDKIFNMSDASDITVFPKKSLNEVL